MARTSAINPVADAGAVALNVTALNALCPGGVYRNEPPAQTPPYVSIGPCAEVPWDAIGPNYGAEVTVPVRIVTSGQDANGESRAGTIVDQVLALLDTRASITVTGWRVAGLWWKSNTMSTETHDDGTTGYVCTATFVVQARKE